MFSFDKLMREESRLVILKALAEQVDATLNSSMLVETLKVYGINRGREFVHTELDYLANIGAVVTSSISSVRVATLTERGKMHVDRAILLEGVKRPSLPEV